MVSERFRHVSRPTPSKVLSNATLHLGQMLFQGLIRI